MDHPQDDLYNRAVDPYSDLIIDRLDVSSIKEESGIQMILDEDHSLKESRVLFKSLPMLTHEPSISAQ